MSDFRQLNDDRNYKYYTKFSYSAGILPYQIVDDNIYLLLGQDIEGGWSDFGGRMEIKDCGEPENTAAREFYEETVGSIMSFPSVKTRLSKCPRIESKTLNGSPYYMYILRIPYKSYREGFKSTIQFVKYAKCERKFLEKTDIRWVSLNTIRAVLEDKKNEEILLPLRKIFKNTLNSNFHDILKILNESYL